MTSDDFNTLLESRISKIKDTLCKKAGEYASNEDRLYNFKRGACVLSTTPAECLLGYMTKHFVSVLDMVRDSNKGKPLSRDRIDEKIGDLINYIILLEAVLVEEIGNA